MIRPHYVPLYQSVCTSEKLADLQDDSARLFYVLLLTHCDSWGRCKGGVRILTATVWPMFGKTTADTERALADLARVELIQRYEVDGEQFIAIPDWEAKAGKVGKVDRRGPSLFPPPNAVPTVRKNGPASGPETSSPPDHSCLARAGESDPIRAEPSRAFVAAPSATTPQPSNPSIPDPDVEPPPHETVLAWFEAQYREATGKRYAFEGAKDGRAIKELLERAGDDGVAGVVERGKVYFADPFHREKSGLSLTRFLAAWNALAKAPPTSSAPSSTASAPASRASSERQRREREIERAWADAHTVEREMPRFDGNGTVKRQVVDAKYPGHEAAERELIERGLLPEAVTS